MAVGTVAAVPIAIVTFFDLAPAVVILVAGAVIGWLISIAVSDSMANRLFVTPHQLGLTAAADSCDKRIDGIDIHLSRIVEAKKEIADTASPGDSEHVVVDAMLDRKMSIRYHERNLVTVKRWQIDFERWVNCLEPILANIESASWSETDRRRGLSDELGALGGKFVEAWQKQPAAKTDFGCRFLAEVAGIVVRVAELRKLLALRKSKLADPDASVISAENEPGSALDDTQLAKLRGKIAMARTQISSDVENESLRLDAETEVNREIP